MVSGEALYPRRRLSWFFYLAKGEMDNENKRNVVREAN